MLILFSMGWRRAIFKDQQVWAQVSDDTGTPIVESGRIAIRYQKRSDAKTYKAGSQRVEIIPDAEIEVISENQQGQFEETHKTEVSKQTKSQPGMPGGFGKAGKRTAQQTAMAKQAAKSLVDSLKGQQVICYTDGACRGNPGPAGSGAVVALPSGRLAEACRSLGQATNNIAELTAIILALDLLDEAGVGHSEAGAIFTDSAYCHGVLCKGWKAKANQELVGELKERLAARSAISLYWIAGHAGIEENERADGLANEGVLGVSRVHWSE